MNNSLQKAFFGVIALGGYCIAIELVPVSRQAAYWNRCLDRTIGWINEVPDLNIVDKKDSTINIKDKHLDHLQSRISTNNVITHSEQKLLTLQNKLKKLNELKGKISHRIDSVDKEHKFFTLMHQVSTYLVRVCNNNF